MQVTVGTTKKVLQPSDNTKMSTLYTSYIFFHQIITPLFNVDTTGFHNKQEINCVSLY